MSIHRAARVSGGEVSIRPGSQVGSNLRGRVGVGEKTYRASGITLAKDTCYFLSICEGTSRGVRLSAAGDALAGKGGWSAMGRLFSGVPGVEPGQSVSDSIVPKFAVSASGGAANPNVSVSDTIIRLPSPFTGLSPQSNSSSLSFPVSLSPASREPGRVDYVTRNGTALAGEDYVGSRRHPHLCTGRDCANGERGGAAGRAERGQRDHEPGTLHPPRRWRGDWRR